MDVKRKWGSGGGDYIRVVRLPRSSILYAFDALSVSELRAGLTAADQSESRDGTTGERFPFKDPIVPTALPGR